MAETKPSKSNVTFELSEGGGAAWVFRPGHVELTLEEARVIASINGMHAVAGALDRIADAMADVASAIRDTSERRDAD
jgi:hypothetical protein